MSEYYLETITKERAEAFKKSNYDFDKCVWKSSYIQTTSCGIIYAAEWNEKEYNRMIENILGGQ